MQTLPSKASLYWKGPKLLCRQYPRPVGMQCSRSRLHEVAVESSGKEAMLEASVTSHYSTTL